MAICAYCLQFVFLDANIHTHSLLQSFSGYSYLDIWILDKPIDNSRYKRADFHISCANLIHGVAGYFDVVLYKDIIISE